MTKTSEEQQAAQQKALDDLDAVRKIAEILNGFSEADLERILRWVRERLGMTQAAISATQRQPSRTAAQGQAGAAPVLGALQTQDIKSFVASKNPQGDSKFAATVAYYHQFIAPTTERRDYVTAADLTDACRKADRRRIKRPEQVLVNAYHAGLFDRPERGTYKLNSVGENLVAMVLPESAPAAGKSEVKRRPPRAPETAGARNRRKPGKR